MEQRHRVGLHHAELANSYSTQRSGIGDFVVGVGWNPGSNETVNFNGSLSASGGTSLVSLYGWPANPLVEYYVMGDYDGSSPRPALTWARVTSDGATYNIYEHQQVNQHQIMATESFGGGSGNSDIMVSTAP